LEVMTADATREQRCSSGCVSTRHGHSHRQRRFHQSQCGSKHRQSRSSPRGTDPRGARIDPSTTARCAQALAAEAVTVERVEVGMMTGVMAKAAAMEMAAVVMAAVTDAQAAVAVQAALRVPVGSLQVAKVVREAEGRWLVWRGIAVEGATLAAVAKGMAPAAAAKGMAPAAVAKGMAPAAVAKGMAPAMVALARAVALALQQEVTAAVGSGQWLARSSGCVCTRPRRGRILPQTYRSHCGSMHPQSRSIRSYKGRRARRNATSTLRLRALAPAAVGVASAAEVMVAARAIVALATGIALALQQEVTAAAASGQWLVR